MNTSETLYFHLLLLSGISSIMTSAFKKQILKNPKSTFNVLNPHRVKLLTRLNVGLSRLLQVN